MSTAQSPVKPDRIMQLTWGYAPPLILEAAIRHRVFDVLDNGAKTVEEVEDETGASARGLTALLLPRDQFLATGGRVHKFAHPRCPWALTADPGHETLTGFCNRLLRTTNARHTEPFTVTLCPSLSF